MISLIRADMRRILRKKSFIITLVFLLFSQFLHTVSNSDLPVAEFLTAARNQLGGIVMLFITIVIYLGVFADDQQSRSIVAVIGRGMRRGEVFTAKLIVSVLCSAILFTVAMGLRMFNISLLRIPLSASQKSLLWVYIFFLVVRSAGCLAAAMLAQYLTDSTAAGIITDVVAVIVLKGVLVLAKTFLQVDLYGYSLSGLLDSAYSNVAVGKIPWQLVPAVLIYIAALVWIAAAINQKKEMEL